MQAPKGSRVRLPSPERFRVRARLRQLAEGKNVKRLMLVRAIERDLGLLNPETEAHWRAVTAPMLERFAEARRERERANLKAIFDMALPVLGDLKAYFAEGGLVPWRAVHMPDTDDPVWGGLAKTSRVVASALASDAPFSWTDETLEELRQRKPVDWLLKKLEERTGVGAAKLRKARYGKPKNHRVAK